MGFIKAFLKKYSALVPPICLLVVVLLLVPPMLWLGGKVKADMEQSAKQAQSIRMLMSDVPPRNKPEQIKTYMDRLENEVQQIDALITQSSQRELIAYDIFPEPKDTSSQIFVMYGRNYINAIDGILKSLNALDAPSEAEIRAATGTTRTTPATGRDVEMFGTTSRTRQQDKQNPMVDALCIARAESISVYAKPQVFAWYDFWKEFKFEGTEAALMDCWNSQIALWIYDDVVKSIQAMNLGSEKVSSSPVKRLLGISFTGPVIVEDDRRGGILYGEMMPRGRGGLGQVAAGRDNPNYVTDALPSVFIDTPWTGRKGGEDYDVIHFAVSVIIDNRYVMAFMQELCSEKEHTFYENFVPDPSGRMMHSRHNQITILQDAVHAVDKTSPAHELYRYGNSAVMRLDLVCEYILSRKGYDSIKPKPIKRYLGQMEQQTPTGGVGGGMPSDGITPRGF
jgi:hypothetical protein